jgi:hypothetical protein|tara:strand:- start:567 stop:734 length:168 start_codon:yes stop_codon:yes gene_type:complete
MVVIAFSAFSAGYSVAPMVEVGMIGGEKKNEIGLKSKVDKDMEKFYRNLAGEDGG